jgi:hypothetical protein
MCALVGLEADAPWRVGVHADHHTLVGLGSLP